MTIATSNATDGTTATAVTSTAAAGADPAERVEGARRSERTEREHTRARILAEAVELFAANGFASTTTRELAEHMGFTKAALYYHFRTKDDLLAALAEPIADEVAAMTRIPRRPGDAGRRDLLAGYLDLVVAHRRVIRVLCQDPAVSRNEKVTAIARQGYVPLIEALCVPGQDPVTARTRVLAALGGIHAALSEDGPEEDGPLIRAAALMAACGALGIRPAAAAHAEPTTSVTLMADAVPTNTVPTTNTAPITHLPSQTSAAS
jgi:AcrR family transcriptional regulator